MGVVTRSETLRPVTNPCELCKVKEKMEGGENRLCKLCTEEEKMKSTAEDKTIYVQLRSDPRAIWYAIEEKEKSPDSEIRKKKKKTKKMKKGDDYMKMGGNWRITKLDLPKLPPGYKKNVVRTSAIPFKSRIYLFGGLRYPARFMDPGVSDVLSFDVRLWEWHSSPPMSYKRDEPCAIASDDGQNIVLLDFEGVKTFIPHDNSSGSSGSSGRSGGSGGSGDSSGYWGQDVSHGSIKKDKFFNFYLFSAFEEDNKKKLLLYCPSHFFLMKYDLQSKSLEYIQEDFGKWHGGGVVLFDHYLFCFGIPGGRRSGKPRSLYAFNLRNLKLHSKVRNLPKPDDKSFPEEDDYVSPQLACLLKINDSNDKLALIWSTMDCCTDYQTMLRVMKFTIVKSETGKLFEACILSKGHCVVDGHFPISCLAMPIGQEGQGKPIDQEGQGRPIGQEGQGKKKQKRI